MLKRWLALVLICLAICPTVFSEGDSPVDVTAQSAILMEPESGQIICEKNADERRPVASVTKVMTILLACEAVEANKCTLDDPVSISAHASGMGGSQVLLDTGETQSYGNLLKSMIVASANDAAVALAEYLCGSEEAFVRQMNRRAEEMGLENTHFVNCTGLPADGHYTTAHDVAVMSAALIRHKIYFQYSTVWMDTLEHEGGRITELTNTNRMTRLYEGCDGIKTGSTKEAGYCISASAVRGGTRLIAVVLASATSKDRFSDAQALLDYGFANYRSYTAAKRGTKVRGGMPVTGGSKSSVPLELGADLTLLIAKGEEQDIALEPRLPQSVPAPVEKGQQIGLVTVQLGGKQLGQVPVVAAESVARQNYADGWRRLIERWLLCA